MQVVQETEEGGEQVQEAGPLEAAAAAVTSAATVGPPSSCRERQQGIGALPVSGVKLMAAGGIYLWGLTPREIAATGTTVSFPPESGSTGPGKGAGWLTRDGMLSCAPGQGLCHVMLRLRPPGRTWLLCNVAALPPPALHARRRRTERKGWRQARTMVRV